MKMLHFLFENAARRCCGKILHFLFENAAKKVLPENAGGRCCIFYMKTLNLLEYAEEDVAYEFNDFVILKF